MRLRGRLQGLAASRHISPSYALCLWLVCIFLLGRSYIDSWPFPWYGNPDQDLVFLRDGLRLWRGQVPGYGDHPGLMQMLVVKLALGALRIKSYLGLPDAIHFGALVDADWQLLFRTAKFVNVLLMSFLLLGCAVLLASLLGRLSGLLWVVMCATSMGVVTEVYQLRNEFYSSYLSIAAILVALSICKSLGQCRDSVLNPVWRGSCMPFSAAAIGAFALNCSAFVAKVQVLLVLVIFVVWVLIAGFQLHRIHFIRTYFLCLAGIAVGLIAVAFPFLWGVEISWFQCILVVVGLAGSSAMIVAVSWLFIPLCLRQRAVLLLLSVIGCMAVGSAFLRFANDAHWLRLLVNPLRVSQYAVSGDGCQSRQIFCLLAAGGKGLTYLFERSVDSYLLAPYAMIATLGILLVVIVWLGRFVGTGFSGNNQPVGLVAWSGCGCLVIAFAMAFIAGQRWAVDHYLSYQQPFLFAGLLCLARMRIPLSGLSRGILLLVFVSLLLIFVRYPESAGKTYIKEKMTVVAYPPFADRSLCAPQHAGSEWMASSLWNYCNQFRR